MGWRESGVTTILAGTLLLALIYAYLYRQHKRSFLGLWALAWISSTVHYSFRLAIDIVGLSSPLYFVCQMMSLTTSMCILWGAFVFAGKSSHRGWLVVVHVVVLWMGIMVFSESAAWLMIPVSLFVGYAYVRAGIVFLGLRDIGGPAPVITGISFMLVGVMKAGEPLHPELSWLDTWNYRVAAILGVFMAVGMLLVYFEKMRSEAAEGELRYRLLAENARDVIFRCRVFPSMKIEYVSPSVERITGYSPEEFYQNPEVWAKVVAGNDLSLVGEIISSLLAQSTTPFGDEAGSLLRRVSSKADMPGGLFLLQLSHQDGRIVPTEQQVVPVYDGRGRVVAIEGICRDISDRVRAEDEKEKLAEQLLQSQKMEALGLLAGGVAHDMNNVLAAIMGVASLLHRRLRGDNSNAAFLETILSSCKRGRDLTRNLLGFARKRMMRKDRVCLNQVVDNVVSLLGMTLPKGIAVDKSLEPVLPAIEGDSGHLEQVLMNLCINASDAIGQSGTIRVSTSVAQLTEDNLTANPEATPGTFVELRVVDSGEGMDRETMERVFEPFFTTKEQGKGTGLGMSMVYGAVRGHGGFVTIESDVGNGTTVTLRFPVTGASANNEAKVLEPKSNLDPGGKTVLLVDDEEAVRQIGKAMLEELGYRVLVAEGGEVACHIYEEQGDTIALVVLDFAMPGMDGGATYMRLREIAPNLLVLFASAYGQDSLPDYLVQKEIGEVLQKPFSIDELALAVSRVLGSEK